MLDYSKFNSFLYTTTPVVLIRLIISIVLFKWMYSIDFNSFSSFNKTLIDFNFYAIITTLHIGKIISQNKIVLIDALESIIVIPIFFCFVSILYGSYIFFEGEKMMLLITLSTPFLLVNHIVFSVNNTNFKYQKNNLINFLTYLVALVVCTSLLLLNMSVDIISFAYIFILSIFQFFLVFLLDRENLSFSFLFFKNLNFKRSPLSIFQLLSYNLVYLNPLIIYYLFNNFVVGYIPAFGELFEIYYRGFSMLFSLIAVLIVSYIIPSFYHKKSTVKFYIIIFIGLLILSFICLVSYVLFLNPNHTFTIIDIILCTYFVYKVFEFCLISFNVSTKKNSFLLFYTVDLILFLAICI